MKKLWIVFLTVLLLFAVSSCDQMKKPDNTGTSQIEESTTNGEDETTLHEHTIVIDAVVAATCKNTGLTEGSHCSVCNEIIVAQEVVPVTNDHTPETDEAVPATCTSTGLTEGNHCLVCNKVLTAQIATLALEHDMVEATCMRPATCKRNCGYTERNAVKHTLVDGTCTGCGAKAISTADELKAISLSGNYILVNDIDLGEAEWTPLGTDTEPFSGTFDGNGYTICNIKITGQYNYYGLFGYNSGTIQNLGIEAITISSYVRMMGAVYSGSLAGYNKGTIVNCYAEAVKVFQTVNPDGVAIGYAGGLVGYNGGTIVSCYSSGTSVSITSTSWMSATYAYSGGLVGCNKDGTITNSYSAIKEVSGTYSGSNMAHGSYVGGLVGVNQDGIITNCYRDSSQTFKSTINSSTNYKSTNSEGTATELSALQTVAFYTDTLGWATDIWVFTEGSLPKLKDAFRVNSVD